MFKGKRSIRLYYCVCHQRLDYLLVKLEDGWSEASTPLSVQEPFRFVFCFHGWYRSSASANDAPEGTSRSKSHSGLSAMNCTEASMELLSSGDAKILLGLEQPPSRSAMSTVSSVTLETILDSSWVELLGGLMRPDLHTLFELLTVLSSEIHLPIMLGETSQLSDMQKHISKEVDT